MITKPTNYTPRSGPRDNPVYHEAARNVSAKLSPDLGQPLPLQRLTYQRPLSSAKSSANSPGLQAGQGFRRIPRGDLHHDGPTARLLFEG